MRPDRRLFADIRLTEALWTLCHIFRSCALAATANRVQTRLARLAAGAESFAADHERNNVCVYAVFLGTHSGEGGPVPPTGKSTSSDYVYVMEFRDGKISQMTKIWNAGWAMRELGRTG